jgi:hypothetical protein
VDMFAFLGQSGSRLPTRLPGAPVGTVDPRYG